MVELVIVCYGRQANIARPLDQFGVKWEPSNSVLKEGSSDRIIGVKSRRGFCRVRSAAWRVRFEMRYLPPAEMSAGPFQRVKLRKVPFSL